MRTAAWMVALVIGALALVVGCLDTIMVVQVSTPIPMEGSTSGGGMSSRIYPVARCAFAGGDAVGVPRWPARLVLIAALASFWLALTRGRRSATIACGALALSLIWLFIEIASLPPEDADLFTLDLLSARRVSAWTAWAALAGGTFLLAAGAWVRDKRATRIAAART